MFQTTCPNIPPKTLQEIFELREKEQNIKEEIKNQNINEKNSQDDIIWTKNNFYLGVLNYKDKSGNVKTKKRYAFDTAKLYQVIQYHQKSSRG